MVSDLALFCLATYLATFPKNGQFKKSSGHPERHYFTEATNRTNKNKQGRLARPLSSLLK